MSVSMVRVSRVLQRHVGVQARSAPFHDSLGVSQAFRVVHSARCVAESTSPVQPGLQRELPRHLCQPAVFRAFNLFW